MSKPKPCPNCGMDKYRKPNGRWRCRRCHNADNRKRHTKRLESQGKKRAYRWKSREGSGNAEARYIPTPDEIAAACLEIQAKWTASMEHAHRQGWRYTAEAELPIWETCPVRRASTVANRI